MKIRSRIWLVVLATTIVGYWITASNGADDSSAGQSTVEVTLVPTAPAVPVAPAAPVLPRIQQMQQLEGPAAFAAKAIAGGRARTNMAGSIRTAAEAVRDAKGDEAKDNAKKALSELLGKYFDEDTKRREEELTQIEERLAKLRELLDRRRTKKQDILDLQMKVALNEADGLGFYDSEHSGGTRSTNTNMYFYDFEGGANPNPFASPTKTNAAGSVAEPKKNKSESKSSLSK